MTISFSKEQQEAGRLYEHALSVLALPTIFSAEAVRAAVAELRSPRCANPSEAAFAERIARLIEDIHAETF